ncbi:hypothetical protein B2D07_18940 [Desulfococcus multivorans]|uniref:Uncharacterized protein n=1 Tax=Desulfococcus multivorans DSM 2059 TaxID=1121405 RepID=S7TRK0_DESML|nr:hypothetical protein B2D07_18940 [Desulfococcus multivorans]EPR39742.1 hypothetical protein dsmv_2590 [Desulfococcus multivorans DSM 2059]SKA05127.1 hypothetical protein SAMN02745446_02577 [Desulfococcus multivorans DSM 2059]
MSVIHTCITGPDNKIEERELTLGKAIRLHCLECLGFSPDEVSRCSHQICPLHPFRFGRDPSHTREMTDEQKAATAARLKAARQTAKIED